MPDQSNDNDGQDVDLRGTPAVEVPEERLIKAAFGQVNRERLISDFLVNFRGPAWEAVYRLILWADKTTGLAHCYESDKCQPGKNWHERNLRFHDWLAGALGCEPMAAASNIDWLFRQVADDYARFMVRQYQLLLAKAARQRAAYSGRGFPEPGDDPEIVQIIREELGEHLTGTPTPAQWRAVTTRLRDLVKLDNKRKNIVGEGFEDVLAALLRRADVEGAFEVLTRRILHEIPGFQLRRDNEKPVKVDVALVRRVDQRRTMVTVKWSTRADREEQIKSDYNKYTSAQSSNQPFDYVMVTNEFDPARLKRACDWISGNSLMLHRVVHISPTALRAVYGQAPEPTMSQVLDYIDDGRIVSIDDWFNELLAPSRAQDRPSRTR